MRAEFTAARRVFIWKSDTPDVEPEIRELVAALRRHGPNMLMWVRPDDANHRPGLVEYAMEGLLLGYLKHSAADDATDIVDLEGWLTLCRNAVVTAAALRRCGEWSRLAPNEPFGWRPDVSVPLEETSLAESAAEIHIEQSRSNLIPSGPITLGEGFRDSERQSLAAPPGTAEVRSAVFHDVIMPSAAVSLLVKDGRKVFETHRGSLAPEQFRQARANLNLMRWEATDKLAVIGYNRAGPAVTYGHYHWMMESVVSLDIAVQRFGAERCALVLPILPAQCEETLSLLGLASVQRIIADVGTGYFFRSVCYVEYLGGISNFFLTPRAMGTFDRMAAAVQPNVDGPKRIYIARTDSASRRMINEAEVQTLMRANGFTCVVLGGMSIAEQIDLFRGAEIIVGPHGAGFTNLVFCRPGTRVLELFMATYPNMCMARIAQTRHLDYRAEAFESSDEANVYERRWAVDVGRLAATLRQLV